MTQPLNQPIIPQASNFIGPDPSSTKAVFAISGQAGGGDGYLGMSFDSNGKPFGSASGMNDVKIHEDEVLLLAAKDRGVTYKPPTLHLGQPVEASTAREVVTFALPYIETMVTEAETLDPPS